MKNYGGHFDPETKTKRLQELENVMGETTFWDNPKNSEQVISEANNLRKILTDVSELKNKVTGNIDLLESLKEDFDQEIKDLLESDLEEITTKLNNLEVSILLNQPYDHGNALLEIHAGAGGTEACDWAAMLYRMFIRYCEKSDFKYEVLDEQPGDGAGFKSVTMIVRGINAYGYLKNEKGVHRLVRISPFDANSKRHTSFASVNVTPLFENQKIDIEIKDSDLKINVYRSTGAGGQSVNTTDSAVRITHLPTKIVVTCQNERSQQQNREKALEILKSKLYQLEIEAQEAHFKNINGELMEINFGSQIRSYVMHPYSLVKDHRTNVEATDVNRVLDGDIDLFINANLKRSN